MGDPPAFGIFCFEIVGPKKPAQKPSRLDNPDSASYHRIGRSVLLSMFWPRVDAPPFVGFLCFQTFGPQGTVHTVSRPGQSADSAPYNSFRQPVLLIHIFVFLRAAPHVKVSRWRSFWFPKSPFTGPADQARALIQHRTIYFVYPCLFFTFSDFRGRSPHFKVTLCRTVGPQDTRQQSQLTGSER